MIRVVSVGFLRVLGLGLIRVFGLGLLRVLGFGLVGVFGLGLIRLFGLGFIWVFGLGLLRVLGLGFTLAEPRSVGRSGGRALPHPPSLYHATPRIKCPRNYKSSSIKNSSLDQSFMILRCSLEHPLSLYIPKSIPKSTIYRPSIDHRSTQGGP